MPLNLCMFVCCVVVGDQIDLQMHGNRHIDQPQELQPLLKGIPGTVVRSVSAEHSGMPAFQHGTYISDHRSDFKHRWGGWYVPGDTGAMKHMGNSVTKDRHSAELVPIPDRFDPTQYLTPHSDVVSLLVLEHQTHVTNLLTQPGFEIRHALHHQDVMNETFKDPVGYRSESTLRRIRQAVEELVDYLLFVEETPLPKPFRGSSRFTETFAAQGPRDQWKTGSSAFR